MSERIDDRPRTWDEYIGQDKLKQRLETYIGAAKKASTSLDHILLCGPPGVGKTALASLIAQKLDRSFQSVIMPVKTDILKQKCRTTEILFLDELHRAPVKLQEEMLPVLEDGFYQLSNGHKLHCPNLTIIGATTEPENIIPPLYDRFTLKPMYEPYTFEQMEQILIGMADRMETVLPKPIVSPLANAANGIPRNARQLVVSVRALGRTRKSYTAGDVLDLAGLTSDGLTDQHIEYLRSLDSLGGRAGLSTMVTILRLHPKVVNELERTLLEKELISFRSTGRELAPAGWTILTTKTK